MPMKKDSGGQQKEKIPRNTTMTVTDKESSLLMTKYRVTLSY